MEIDQKKIKKENQETQQLFERNKKKAKLSKADKIRVGGNSKLKALFGHATYVFQDWKTNMVLGSLTRKENGKTIAVPAMVDKRWKKKNDNQKVATISVA